jgi:hypothetical protein
VEIVVVLADLPSCDVEQIEWLVEADGMHSNQTAGLPGSDKTSSLRTSTASRSLKGRPHGQVFVEKLEAVRSVVAG